MIEWKNKTAKGTCLYTSVARVAFPLHFQEAHGATGSAAAEAPKSLLRDQCEPFSSKKGPGRGGLYTAITALYMAIELGRVVILYKKV